MSGSIKQHVIQKNSLYYVQDDGKRSEKLMYVVFDTFQRVKTQKTIVAHFSIYKGDKEVKSKLQKEFVFKIEDFVTTVLDQENISKQSLLGTLKAAKTRSCLSVLVCDEDKNEQVISFEMVESAESSKTEDCVERDILAEWNAKIRSNLEYRMDWPLDLDKLTCDQLKIECCETDNFLLCLTSRMLAVVQLQPIRSVVCWSLRLLRKYTGQKSSLELMVESKQNVHETFRLTVADACSVAEAIKEAVTDFGKDKECQNQAQNDKCVDSIKENFVSRPNEYVVNRSRASNPVFLCRPPEPCMIPPTHVPAPSPQIQGSEDRDCIGVLDSQTNFSKENPNTACVAPPPVPCLPPSIPSRVERSKSSDACANSTNSCDSSVSHQPLPHTTYCQQGSAPSHSQPHIGNGEHKHTVNGEASDLTSSSLQSRKNKPLPPEPQDGRSKKPIPAPRKMVCNVCNRTSCDCLKLPEGDKWKIGHTLGQVIKKRYPTPDTLKLTTPQRACLHAQLSLLPASGMTVWQIVGEKIGLSFEDVQVIEGFVRDNCSFQSGELVLYHWQFLHNRNESCIPCEVSALKDILEEDCPSILEEVFN